MGITSTDYDLDDFLYRPRRNKEEVMSSTKKSETKYKDGVGLDVGTGFICACGYTDKGNPSYRSLRDAFFPIDKDVFKKQMFDKNSMKYVEIDDVVNVIGEDALTLAKIRNTSAKRPLASGIINPKERASAPILKEMFRYCVEPYKNRDGENLVFSIPGPKFNDDSFNTEYHSMSLQSLLSSFGFNAEPLNEAYAVVISELEKAKDVTGLGFSFGAGLVNVAFVYKSMLLFSFSIDKSGDFIDQEAARAVGASESNINHIKETRLNLTDNEFEATAEERALIFTYRHVIRNTIRETIRAFNESEDINIIEPIPVIVSGGTSMPKGFMNMFKDEFGSKEVPFEIDKFVESKNKLNAVAKGCALYAMMLGED